MDDTKLEEPEKAYKKEENHKVRVRMVAVRMVRVQNMSVGETACIYTEDQKFVHSVSYFLLANLMRSRLNLTVR